MTRLARLLATMVVAVGMFAALPASAATVTPTCQPTINAARALATTGDFTGEANDLLGEEDSALVDAILSHPTRDVATSLARQACLSWRVHFGDCLSLDLTAVPCEMATWRVTGVEEYTTYGEMRCRTGETIPLRGPRAVFCLYPNW